MNRKFERIAFSPADILLPKGIDLTKWAVIACDQFSSEPEYWEAVEKTVGDAPSTLRLILPEAKLNSPDVDRHIADINAAMERYLKDGLFETLENALIYVERVQSDGKVRAGLVGKIDLEQYNFTPGSGSLVRATEGTVLSRIPPRVKVREDAPIEVPHVMLLMDDPEDTVLGPLNGAMDREPLYSFSLQQGGGSIRGWKLSDEQADMVADALAALCTPSEMARKYGITNENGDAISPLLFAVGDGNHSLASAKQCYENLKKVTPPETWSDLPARYALVEIVNNHSPALEFEPIHRVLSGINPADFLAAFREAYPNAEERQAQYGAAEENTGGEMETGHTIEFIWQGYDRFWTVPDPTAQLAVGTLQSVIDRYLEAHGGKTGISAETGVSAEKRVQVDYIHGTETARKLGSRPGCMAFLLPAMEKNQLFKTVMADGVLPRKTFSMGQARDKRYYLEARKIR